ncbi:MAG: ABC transporter substrate-binding protein, partial [Clostridia bacterium]|nr:ABC transporter substrate-binding protein [Clostridia bacterium]
MKRFSKLLALLLCLSMILSACGGGSTSTASSAESKSSTAASTASGSTANTGAPVTTKEDKESLVYAAPSEPGKLDPQANGIIHGMMIEKQVYEPLIARDPATDELIPGLATAWEWVDDTHLKLTLREGVKFHNGDDFNADDVLFTLQRIAVGSATSSLYKPFDAENSTKNGDYEVTIAFKYAFAPALNFLTNPRAFMVSKEYVEANGEGCLDQYAMGTGPYKFVEWMVGSSVTLESNPEYWGGEPAIKNLTVRFIGEDTARMIALETGEVDFASQIQSSDIDRALAGEIKGVIGYAVPSYKVWHLDFNVSTGEKAEIFQKKEARLAIAHAVDWQATIETACGSVAMPAESCL